MCVIPVLYATTDGQTRRIAERLAILFKEHGLASAAIDVESERAALFNWRTRSTGF
jgi:menaquinone-dependent protoporphyrinogen IX oxidase